VFWGEISPSTSGFGCQSCASADARFQWR